MTSSIVAMGAHLKSGRIDANSWSDPDQINTYAKSNTLAERSAWEFYNAQTGDNKMEIVVINPGDVMGPSLTDGIVGPITKAKLTQNMRIL